MSVSASLYGTFNLATFAGLLSADAGAPEIVVAAVHSHLPGAVFASASLPGAAADAAVVVTAPQSVLGSVADVLNGGAVDPMRLEAEVDAFSAGVRALARNARLTFVATWIAPYRYSGGALALDPGYGLDAVLAAANRRLVETLRTASNCHVLNAGGWQHLLGARAFSPKGWFLTKDPYTFELWKLAAGDVKTAWSARAGGAKKLLIVDLDNTLWGGEVGDAGVDGLRLGGHDAAGEAYVAFQRELAALARRGIVLAVVSKNDEPLAMSAIDGHPEMVLRRDDFAGWRINWNDKAANVVDLCAELELSPADAVFIDDNPGERSSVAAALPELTVPDWPANPLLFVDALWRLNAFDVPAITDEDLLRARGYAAQRLRNAPGPGDDEVAVEIQRLEPADMPRTLQLLNKTNQMNATTRRFSEEELAGLAASPTRELWTVRVRDRFAEYGLTGAIALEFTGQVCTVSDFVMSCRVMSRGVEERMLDRAREAATAHGCTELWLRFVPTERNEPMRRFLIERSGLRSDDGIEFAWSQAAAESTLR